MWSLVAFFFFSKLNLKLYYKTTVGNCKIIIFTIYTTSFYKISKKKINKVFYRLAYILWKQFYRLDIFKF